MATNVTPQEIAKKLHSLPGRGCIVVTGSGIQAISDLFSEPGASRTILEAQVPYSRKALHEFVGEPTEQHVSALEAQLMARAALKRAEHLAEGDDGDPQRYPGFDDFYEGLDTKLSKDDVRRWTRYEVRDQISDLRGAVYPGQRALGDAQEDAQLQEAIRVLMKAEGRDIRDVTALKNVFKIDFDGKKTAKAAESSK